MAVSLPALRRTYAQRADALADLINQIAVHNHDPHVFHERRDQAARAARQLARSLESDRL